MACIANVYRRLKWLGLPSHVSHHSPRIQLGLNEYDSATGNYELRYDVILLDSDDLLLERKTVSSKLQQLQLGLPPQEDDQEAQKLLYISQLLFENLCKGDENYLQLCTKEKQKKTSLAYRQWEKKKGH